MESALDDTEVPITPLSDTDSIAVYHNLKILSIVLDKKVQSIRQIRCPFDGSVGSSGIQSIGFYMGLRLEHGCGFLQKLADREVLGASVFALSALDAIGCLTCVFGMEAIIERAAAEGLFRVHASEDAGDRDVLGATVDAIAASGTGNEILCAEDLADAIDRLLLLCGEGSEVLHIADVIVHHIHIAHTREHHEDAVEACGKADGIGCIGAAAEGIEHVFRFVGEVHKAAALDGFHDDDGLIILAADLIAEAGLDRGVVIVDVIELELNDLDLGICDEDFFEHRGLIVEGDTEVLDLTLFLEFEGGLVSAARLIFFEELLILRVHEVEVEVFDATASELGFEEGADVLVFFEEGGGELIREDVAFAGVTGGEAFLQRLFAFTADVIVCGIEIIEAVFEEGIDHFREFDIVDGFAVHREAHAAEAEVFLVIGKKGIHVRILSWRVDFCNLTGIL